ncbi:MAG: NusG domain II-containing protein [Clostridia bacterium]|nr:NusG domain II-containing protein [Clostridia bacterium]
MLASSSKGSLLRRDLFLVLLLLLLSCVSLGVFFLTREEGAEVTVSVNGVAVGVYSLNENGSYPINGGTNLLVIENGTARMEEADCPDRTCVRTGRIRYAGQRIVCLPNRVTVTVTGDDTDLTV